MNNLVLTRETDRPRAEDRFPGAVIDEFPGPEGIVHPVRVAVLGKRWAGRSRDWSFSALRTQKDALDDNRPLITTLRAIGKRLDIVRFLAPIPTRFNGVVLSNQDALDLKISLGDGVHVYRGAYADGVALSSRGQAFAVSTGGCPVIVLWRSIAFGTRIVAAHAGLQSLVRWHEGQKSLKQSVTTSLVRALKGPRESLQQAARKCYGAIVIPIDPLVFRYPTTHPDYGKTNEQLVALLQKRSPEVLVGEPEHGCIDVAELALQQLTRLGVPREHIEKGAHTGELDDQLWTTCPPTPVEHRHRRNLVIVTPR